jgi:hypothetical protein
MMAMRAARALHFEHRRHVDEHDVQRMPARGRYGENSVGSDGNSACTGLMPTKPRPRRGQPQQLGEVGEVADAPVVAERSA